MKIEQITNEFISIFHTKTTEENLLKKILDHMNSYQQILDKVKNDDEMLIMF